MASLSAGRGPNPTIVCKSAPARCSLNGDVRWTVGGFLCNPKASAAIRIIEMAGNQNSFVILREILPYVCSFAILILTFTGGDNNARYFEIPSGWIFRRRRRSWGRGRFAVRTEVRC